MSSPLPALPELSQDPLDVGFVQDPYPTYDRMRDLGSLVHWHEYNMTCAVSFAAANAILRDRRFGRMPIEAPSPPTHLAPFYAVEAHSMLELEPPRHTRLRNLVLRAFTSRRIAGLGPEIEALSHQLIDALPEGPFDLITEFAQRLPVTIIARLLGVPEALAPDLLRWSNAMVAMYQAGRTREDEARAVAATEEFVAFLRGYISARRRTPRDDLITHLIAAEEGGEHLSTDEMISTSILLLNAGHEATVHSIGNAVKTLLQSGHYNSPITEALVEECLRYDPPLHLFTRWAYEDIDVVGRIIPQGTQVACLLGAANRCPRHWDSPDIFDPNRVPKPHLAFGAGLHFCLGAPLARLELHHALRALATRLPQLALVQTPHYADIYHFHGLSSLMVSDK